MSTTRILFCLSDKQLEQVDVIAREESRTRSELVREALRQYIKEIKIV